MKKNKGITLIALIITIIILIILTAITLNNVIGTDLIGFATKAAENYTDAEKEESSKIDELIGQYGVGEDSKVKAGEIVAKTVKDNYTDTEGRTATIPAGFKVSTNAEEQNIKSGLVIQDKDGNEFVWVPCYVGKKPENAPDDLQEYKKHKYIENDEWKLTNFVVDTWGDQAAENYGNVSITKYGGFYIGRYEAGVPEEKQPTLENPTYDSKTIDKNTTTYGKPISKANKFSWNFIDQATAKKVSESMYSGSDSIYSKLVDGTAWDTVLNWIATTGIDVNVSNTYGNYADNGSNYIGLYAKHVFSYQEEQTQSGILGFLCVKNITTGSTVLKASSVSEEDWKKEKENISESDKVKVPFNASLGTEMEIPTGSVENFKLNNIYDLAGNMIELTTEISRTS